MQCLNCGSNRIVDDSPVFMPVKAVKRQICGWRKGVSTAQPKPIPRKGKWASPVEVDIKQVALRRKSLKGRRAAVNQAIQGGQ